MIIIEQSIMEGVPNLAHSDFIEDKPYGLNTIEGMESYSMGLIEGVRVAPLNPSSDTRGSLSELIDPHTAGSEPIVHIYQVIAKADSRRAWQYHRRQFDRLAFTNGHFRIALYDLRADSNTFGLLNVLVAGADQPMSLRIPPMVVHGVHNYGTEDASFINMPTQLWNPARPDKYRIREKDPRIPFSFDA
jgi:dTDP-4-dehydrorhamnose 3,5-epimerase